MIPGQGRKASLGGRCGPAAIDYLCFTPGGRFLRFPTGPQCAIDRFRPVQQSTVADMETHFLDRNDILLTRCQVEALCRLSTSSIYRFMRDGLFPEPIRVGRRAVRWHMSEIDEWLASRPRATGDHPASQATDIARPAPVHLGDAPCLRLHPQAFRTRRHQQQTRQPMPGWGVVGVCETLPPTPSTIQQGDGQL